MGLRIQNNIAAMNAHKQLSIADSGMTKSLERLSSGYRINKAADDAAGLAISQQFRADIASFKVASRNTAEAGSLLQVAEGAMDQIGNMLTRLKELATQAASANAGSNLDKIESEKDKLISEIDRIANSTEYAGSKLLDGTFGTASASWDNEDATSNVSLDTVNGN
ncbi:MAG: flagellin, partial [Syntrophales bacterium]